MILDRPPPCRGPRFGFEATRVAGLAYATGYEPGGARGDAGEAWGLVGRRAGAGNAKPQTHSQTRHRAGAPFGNASNACETDHRACRGPETDLFRDRVANAPPCRGAPFRSRGTVFAVRSRVQLAGPTTGTCGQARAGDGGKLRTSIPDLKRGPHRGTPA